MSFRAVLGGSCLPSNDVSNINNVVNINDVVNINNAGCFTAKKKSFGRSSFTCCLVISSDIAFYVALFITLYLDAYRYPDRTQLHLTTVDSCLRLPL